MKSSFSEENQTTAFERFRELTRKLIKVPKEELDQRLAEEKARKVAPMIDAKTV